MPALDIADNLKKKTVVLIYHLQWRPGIGPPHKANLFSVPIHKMYYHVQKADRPTIRDTDHPFSVPNHRRTRKTDQP